MIWSSDHIKWLVDTGERLLTEDGRPIEIWEFRYQNDSNILSAWARHFRNHYCADAELDFLRKGYGYSRAQYLKLIKFPDRSHSPGPSIRAGDFGEILVADYLEYVMHFWVPRTRYSNKTIRNESSKGSDIIGMKILKKGKDSIGDLLAIFEAKAQFSGNAARPRLQDAIDDSIKDEVRKAESLNAIKQRLFDKGLLEEAGHVDRFQNLEDRPYTELYGAVALFSTECFDCDVVSQSTTTHHPSSNNLALLVIRGNEMMSLVHDLYRRATDEA